MPDNSAACAARCQVKRRAVIVAGMHRSGTSALTRVLSYCGLGIPRTPVPANEGNRLGHWESRLVCQFNDRLLARAGLDWISCRAAAGDLANEPDYADLLRDGGRIVLEEYGTSADIVFKDPRICRLLPFWLEVFADLEIKPVIVLALRAPRQVALSLQRRNAISPNYAFRAWLRFTLEAERATRHVPRVVVGFDQLMDDWRAAVSAINRCAGEEMLACTAETATNVSAFLSTDLRHFKEDGCNLATPMCVARAYGVFAQWQERPETPEDHIELDAVRRALDAAPPIAFRYGIAAYPKWLRRQRERLADWLMRRPRRFSFAPQS